MDDKVHEGPPPPHPHQHLLLIYCVFENSRSDRCKVTLLLVGPLTCELVGDGGQEPEVASCSLTLV